MVTVDDVGPKSVFVRFPFAENPFDSDCKRTPGHELVTMVCGVMNIEHKKCEFVYDERAHQLVLRFRFTRPKWAKRAAERAASINGADVEIAVDTLDFQHAA